MAQASASICKAAEKYTPSIVTTGYSNTSTSEQLIWETRHHAQIEEDEGLSGCFGWLRPFTSFFSTTAPKRGTDRLDRLSWQCAGHIEPVVVNSPTNKLDQSIHLHARASCEESFSGSRPDRANIYKCPGIATNEEKIDIYIKNTRHDSSIDPDTQRLSLALTRIAVETARIWDIYEERASRHKQSLVEDTPSITRKLAGQALETPHTATIEDDSQPASSVDQPSTVGLLGKFIESK
ncbi:hypothetical protein M3J09_010868 [Ascochyta lentis]